MADNYVKSFCFRIVKSSGYKTSELLTLTEGHSLSIGGKEIEVRVGFKLKLLFV